MAIIPVASVIVYFSTGEWLGDIWLVGQRFPVVALMGLIPLLRMPSGLRGTCVTGFVAVLAASSTWNVCQHFARFERDEVGNIEGAIEVMKPGKRVVGLIYDRASTIVNDAPFLHYVSYYQAEKGGIVQFSNSGALYWPVRFRPGHYPPPGSRPFIGWSGTRTRYRCRSSTRITITFSLADPDSRLDLGRFGSSGAKTPGPSMRARTCDRVRSRRLYE